MNDGYTAGLYKFVLFCIAQHVDCQIDAQIISQVIITHTIIELVQYM